MMKAISTAAVSALILGLASCAYNEQLGRRQLVIVGDEALSQASTQAWQQTLQRTPRSTNAAYNTRVRNVGSRIVQAAGLGDRPWEYVVFQGQQANAFVLPGGQIGVYEGLLRAVQNDDQLAAVLGHEVAHVVARHAAERYSTTELAQAGLGAAQSAAGGSSSRTAQAIGALGGVGAQVGVLLPFSRNHELEADRLGVDYMARAGFRPGEAVALWRNLSAARTSGAPPQFLSTHPSDQTRIAQLETYLRTRGWL